MRLIFKAFLNGLKNDRTFVFTSASSGKAERHQVLEQTGLYAENAYHIDADNVHLEGAAIASNNAKASELNTNKLTFNDIENRSSSYAASYVKPKEKFFADEGEDLCDKYYWFLGRACNHVRKFIFIHISQA